MKVAFSAVLILLAAPVFAGTIQVSTDTNWKAIDSYSAGFETFGFDDSSWRNAHDVYNYVHPDTNARIIWDHPDPSVTNPGDPSLPNEAWFRHEFVISEGVGSALLDYIVNDELDIYINGVLVVEDRSGGANSEFDIDVSSFLQTGNNLIAVYGFDGGVTPRERGAAYISLGISIETVAVPGPYSALIVAPALLLLLSRRRLSLRKQPA